MLPSGLDYLYFQGTIFIHINDKICLHVLAFAMPSPPAPSAAIADKSSALRDLLIADLRSGRCPPGAKMPSEWALSRQYGVSRTTVRSALAELTSAGLVVRQQGRGTFVHAQAGSRLAAPQAIAVTVAVVLASQRLHNPIMQAIIARFVSVLDPRARIQLYHHDFLKPAIYVGNGADLVIVDGWFSDEAITALREHCPHVLLVNRVHRKVPFVCIDNRRGGELMAEHVLARGHRRIGILHYGAEGTEEEFMLRLHGIRHVLHAAGVEPEEAALQLHNQRAFTPYQAVELLMRRNPDLTVLVCITDGLALSALEMLGEVGIAVPERLSLMGFDDLSACRYTMPALTTIRHPVDDLGDALAAAVLNRIDGQPMAGDRPIKPQVVTRASVAKRQTGSTP